MSDNKDFKFDSSTDFFDSIPHRVKAIKICESDRSQIDRIDQMILDLMWQRNLLCKNLSDNVSEITSFNSIFYMDSKIFLNDYKKNGLESDSAKESVSRLRSLIFDDTDEKFREYECYAISYNDEYSDYAVFFFMNSKGNRFFVHVPTRSNTERITSLYVGGKFHYSIGRDPFSLTSKGTYTALEMKKMLTELVHLDKFPITHEYVGEIPNGTLEVSEELKNSKIAHHFNTGERVEGDIMVRLEDQNELQGFRYDKMYR